MKRREREMMGAWDGEDFQKVVGDFQGSKWASTSKGWISPYGYCREYPQWYVKLVGNYLTFHRSLYQDNNKWTYELNPEQLGALMMYIVFNNSQNIRKILPQKSQED